MLNQKNKWTFNRQNGKYESSVLKYPSESGGGFRRYHPTQKNLKMIEYLIKIHTNENDVVLDPFMGSGTTGVACMNLNRRFMGIELDESYFNIAKNRIEEALIDKGDKDE
jgi:DNA modification methylase